MLDVFKLFLVSDITLFFRFLLNTYKIINPQKMLEGGFEPPTLGS